MKLKELFELMESFTNLEKDRKGLKREYRLDRMETLSKKLNNPEKEYKIIHVAGSKGKGSTSAYLANILAEAGFKTGLYTSPHIEDYRERFMILSKKSRRFAQEEIILDCGKKILEIVDNNSLEAGSPTTFELLTILALSIFKEEECDWVILETGLGGRLDATNIVMPEASVITAIEKEHCDFLGNTLEEIATEKAGIIKHNRPLFLAPQKKNVHSIFVEKAKKMDSRLYDLKTSSVITYSSLDNGSAHFVINNKNIDAKLGISGKIQLLNASMAINTILTILPEISYSSIKDGLQNAFLPGHSEVLKGNPSLFMDGAHTPESVLQAVDNWKEEFKNNSKKILIFATADDKDADSMAKMIASQFSNIIITTPGFFKPSNPSETYDTFLKYNQNTLLIENPAEALSYAKEQANSDNTILVLGSFYLIGEIKKALKKTESLN